MGWDSVKELFGDTPLTIRVSSEVLIGERVEPILVGIQEFLRPFALVNVSTGLEPLICSS